MHQDAILELGGMFIIKYNGILIAQQYIELVTGRYYCLNADNQLEEFEKIIDKEFGKGTFRNYELEDIGDDMENNHSIVLVEFVNIVAKECITEQEKLYRWFEVPFECTKKEFLERINDL